MKKQKDKKTIKKEQNTYETYEDFSLEGNYLKQQKTKYEWTLWEERTHTELLCNQRCNYFLILFSLLLNALRLVHKPFELIILSIGGGGILIANWYLFNKVYIKLIYILALLHNISISENILTPISMIDKIVCIKGKRKWPLPKTLKIKKYQILFSKWIIAIFCLFVYWGLSIIWIYNSFQYMKCPFCLQLVHKDALICKECKSCLQDIKNKFIFSTSNDTQQQEVTQ